MVFKDTSYKFFKSITLFLNVSIEVFLIVILEVCYLPFQQLAAYVVHLTVPACNTKTFFDFLKQKVNNHFAFHLNWPGLLHIVFIFISVDFIIQTFSAVMIILLLLFFFVICTRMPYNFH